MKVIPYTKKIPIFFKGLLDQIININIFRVADNIQPSDFIHYQPYKSGINIYTSEIIKLSHELSHMIEVKDFNRLIQFDYGMGSYFPKTHKGQLVAVAREARTRGIQTRMVELGFGNPTLLVHRNADKIAPIGDGIGKFKTSQEIFEWSSHITRTAYEETSKDSIMEKWKQKAAFINNWMQS